MKRVSLLASGIVCATFIVGIADAKPTMQKIQRVGTTSMSKASATHTVTDPLGNEFRQGPEEEKSFLKNVTGTVKPARVPSSHVPTPAGMSVTSVAGPGFNGLTHRDQRLADGGNQFSSEPPDQCLAVGGGFVLEGVNSAFRVNSTAGDHLTLEPISMNAFFGLPVAIDRNADPFVYGPFTSDPKCLYDASSGHWFITMLVIDTDPSTGDFLPTASVRIAVSTTIDPTGTYNLFKLDTTNATGTPEHPGCPCFGDQPLIGADANGFYITTNEFPIFAPGFNGAQIYAMSKSMLIANSPPLAVMFSGPPLAEGISYSVQPAMVPPNGAFESAKRGTQYFLSALEFFGGLDNRIAVWAMTNTKSLSDAVPDVALHSAVLDSQVYGAPPAAQQKDGPLPLARLIESGVFGKTGKQHLPLIESNDDRMQQTVFASGRLWSSLTTVIKTANGPVRSGAAWFSVTPSWSAGQLGGTVSAQGIVSVNNRSILFPAIGVNNDGFAVMGFTLVGTDMFPSAAYAVLGTGGVNVVAAGVAPDDGLTGYPIFTGANTGRWGDYSAAATDEDGNIWFATEYIPAGPRTALANWGTFIAKVAPVVAPSP
ncbi:MAG: hypothetical protein ABJB04_05010 [Betaproteobacteria bacterium]